jgi:UDP-glucose 4-epimerase
MSRVLVVGPGFLGSAILSYLIKNTKDDVYTLSRSPNKYYQHIECDLLDVLVLKRVLDELEPEIVYHCGGSPIVKMDEENPSYILKQNIEGTFNLIHNLKNCPRFIYASSVNVYGEFNREHPPSWVSFTKPVSLYGVTKLASENLLRVYAASGRLDPVSIRLASLCGGGATHGLVLDLIRKVESNSPTLDLFGVSPGSKKPFHHVDEIAELFYKIGTEKVGYDEIGQTCLVGNTDSLDVKTIAELVMRELGKKKEITWSGSSWPGDINEIYLNPCLKPRSNSTESIIKTIKQYKESRKAN